MPAPIGGRAVTASIHREATSWDRRRLQTDGGGEMLAVFQREAACTPNLNAGINSAFGVGGKQSAVAIFKVREALDEANPVAAWTRHFPSAKDPNSNADLKAWIASLAANENYVGLYNLGLGAARIQYKHRFTKNLRSQDQARHRLHRGSRRTIHMNLAADPTWDASNPTIPNMKVGGLDEIQQNDPHQIYGRAITSSEYRHAQKLAGTGPGHINFYSEIKDPPPPPPPIAAPVLAGNPGRRSGISLGRG